MSSPTVGMLPRLTLRGLNFSRVSLRVWKYKYASISSAFWQATFRSGPRLKNLSLPSTSFRNVYDFDDSLNLYTLFPFFVLFMCWHFCYGFVTAFELN